MYGSQGFWQNCFLAFGPQGGALESALATRRYQGPSILTQWFSNFRGHQNHLGRLLTCCFLKHRPKDWTVDLGQNLWICHFLIHTPGDLTTLLILQGGSCDYSEVCWICCCVHLDPGSLGFRPELPCVHSFSPVCLFIERDLASDQSIWGMPGERMGVVEACSSSYPPFNSPQLLLFRRRWYQIPKSSTLYFKIKSWLFLLFKKLFILKNSHTHIYM